MWMGMAVCIYHLTIISVHEPTNKQLLTEINCEQDLGAPSCLARKCCRHHSRLSPNKMANPLHALPYLCVAVEDGWALCSVINTKICQELAGSYFQFETQYKSIVSMTRATWKDFNIE